MGVTTYPCPGCGQAQRQEHPNGQVILPTLCPACAEHFSQERDEVLQSNIPKKEKVLALTLLAQRYGADEQSAQNFARLCLADAQAEKAPAV